MEEPRKWLKITASATEEDLSLLQAIAADVGRNEGATSISAVIRRLVRQEAQRRGLVLSNGAAFALADAETESWLTSQGKAAA